MELYCGIDVSNKNSQLCIVNTEGVVVKEIEVPTTKEGIGKIIKKFSGVKCVVEAGPLAETICTIVEEHGGEIEILDPRHADAVTKTRRKTDRLDAQNLAQLCRVGWYKRVHRKSAESRELRSFLTARMHLVKTMTGTASAIRGVLRAQGVVIGAGSGEIFHKKVEKALQNQPPLIQQAVSPLLELWNSCHQKEQEMYKMLEKQVVKTSAPMKLLLKVPGVGPATAVTFVSTIDDPTRFKTPDEVASYIGLVPSIYQSGGVEIRGKITKQGDDLLRWLLVEAATHILCHSKCEWHLRQWGLKLQEKKGFGKARVAVARKLAGLLHHLWVNNEQFAPRAA